MSTHEVVIALEFLYSTLSGDTALAGYAPGGVWRGDAPPGTTTPFVAIEHQSGGVDTLTMNAYRVMSRPLFQVKAVGPTANLSATAQAAAEVDTLLKRTSGSAPGGLILVCYREEPLFLDSLINGEPWTDIGGLYRTEIQQTS